MIKRFVFLTAVLCSTVSICFGYGPSFDCKKAKTAIEKSICASEELSELDFKMWDFYRRIKGNLNSMAPGGAKVIRGDARNWLKKRNSQCGPLRGTKLEMCLEEIYLARNEYLEKELERSFSQYFSNKSERYRFYKKVLPSVDVNDEKKYQATIKILNWYENKPVKKISNENIDIYKSFLSGEGIKLIEPSDRSPKYTSDIKKKYESACKNIDFFIQKGVYSDFSSEDTSTWTDEDHGALGYFFIASEDLRAYDLKFDNGDVFYALYANQFEGKDRSTKVTLGSKVNFFYPSPTCFTFSREKLGFGIQKETISIFGIFKYENSYYYYHLYDNGNCTFSISKIFEGNVDKIFNIEFYSEAVK